MAQFRWAHVNCDEDPAVTIAGPTGSLQFLTGAYGLSGSSNLIFYTASYGTYGANTLVLNGDMVVDGVITASMFVVDQTDTISGSTIFGNSNDDYRQEYAQRCDGHWALNILLPNISKWRDRFSS